MELKKENEATHKEKQDAQLEEQVQLFHVLAVDDSLIERKIIEKLLTVSSYQVTCVDSGNKALEYLGLVDDLENSNTNSISFAPPCACSCMSPPPHQELQGTKVNLIITDYSMPGMSGYDLLRKVKDSSWRDIPVVVMSSENVPARINMCLEGGAEEFLLKPVQLSDLKKLQSHISKPIIHQNVEEEEVEEEEEEEEEENHENHSMKLLYKRKAVSADCSERSRPKMEELVVL